MDIVLATRAGISRVLFGILQVDSPSPTVGIPFLLGYPLLIGFPIASGLVIANGEDSTSETEWESQKLLPIWINESVGIGCPARSGRSGTFF
jgi:hypothetical protein